MNINAICQISLKLGIRCVNVRKQQDCHRLWQDLCLRLPPSLFHLVRVSSATTPQGNLSKFSKKKHLSKYYRLGAQTSFLHCLHLCVTLSVIDYKLIALPEHLFLNRFFSLHLYKVVEDLVYDSSDLGEEHVRERGQ